MVPPETMRALVLRKSPIEQNPTYHDAAIEVQAIQKLKEDEVRVKMTAVAFNSKEVSQ